MKNTIAAFSLPEILITLLILGVLAGIIVPTLLTDSNKTAEETAWKKQFSNISSAFDRIVLDHGGSIESAFSDGAAGNKEYYDYFGDILSIAKRCPASSRTEGCVVSDYTAGGLNLSASNPGYLLNDGTSIYFTSSNSACANTTGSLNYCAIAVVDINGHKGPNKLGRDVFVTYFMKNRLLPAGAQGDAFNADDCSAESGGISCSAAILQTSSLIYDK